MHIYACMHAWIFMKKQYIEKEIFHSSISQQECRIQNWSFRCYVLLWNVRWRSLSFQKFQSSTWDFSIQFISRIYHSFGILKIILPRNFRDLLMVNIGNSKKIADVVFFPRDSFRKWLTTYYHKFTFLFLCKLGTIYQQISYFSISFSLSFSLSLSLCF